MSKNEYLSEESQSKIPPELLIENLKQHGLPGISSTIKELKQTNHILYKLGLLNKETSIKLNDNLNAEYCRLESAAENVVGALFGIKPVPKLSTYHKSIYKPLFELGKKIELEEYLKSFDKVREEYFSESISKLEYIDEVNGLWDHLIIDNLTDKINMIEFHSIKNLYGIFTEEDQKKALKEKFKQTFNLSMELPIATLFKESVMFYILLPDFQDPYYVLEYAFNDQEASRDLRMMFNDNTKLFESCKGLILSADFHQNYSQIMSGNAIENSDPYSDSGDSVPLEVDVPLMGS